MGIEYRLGNFGRGSLDRWQTIDLLKYHCNSNPAITHNHQDQGPLRSLKSDRKCGQGMIKKYHFEVAQDAMGTE